MTTNRRTKINEMDTKRLNTSIAVYIPVRWVVT